MTPSQGPESGCLEHTVLADEGVLRPSAAYKPSCVVLRLDEKTSEGTKTI